jgi:trans-aconitate methyltransferase
MPPPGAGGQTWSPDRYARHARFVSDLGLPLLGLLAPRPGERVLDLGCGDGALTEHLAAAGCRVVAVDSSAEQIDAARRRGLDARVADGEHLPFDHEFDAVFSNAALHWMKRPDAVLRGVHRALRPGGRFVGELGGAGCVATIVAAIYQALQTRGLRGESLDPWYFPTAEEYRARLESSGFAVDTIVLFRRPTPLPGDIIDWLDTFAQAFTAAVPAVERPQFLEDVRGRLQPSLCDSRGVWTADYTRLRFSARSATAATG